MPPVRLLRPTADCLRCFSRRPYSTTATPPTSPFAPRHLLSIADLTPQELTTLVHNAATHKSAIKSSSTSPSLHNALQGKTVAIMFSKRSTRTRVSTEGAVVAMGGHPMFLGSQDIQLGVNESLYDTSVVLSSMVAGMVARVHQHDDVASLARHSSVPVLNALSDLHHPLQALADVLTLHEAFPSPALNLSGIKIAWIGDANNVLFDLALAAAKTGMHLAIATPPSHTLPDAIRTMIATCTTPGSSFRLTETSVPEEAVRDADVLVTDTWISMGQESERATRLREFEGFQITRELARRGGAKEGWKFMHCLPRHPEEVSDEVFYGPGSLVFREAENRLWTAMAAVQGFVVNRGKIESV